MKRPSQRPVALEDLLRLKRAERPPEAFWADFDRGLREKQLAALLRSRPWWQRWADGGFWPAWGRLAFPLGAAGLITGFFLLPRTGGENTAAAGLAGLTEPPSSEVALVVPVVQAAAPELAAPDWSVLAPEVVPAGVEPVALAVAAAAVVAPAGPVPEAAPAPALVAMDSFPMTWAAAGRAETVAAGSLLGASNRFEARAPNARSVVEPLQQMVPPGERRGARILTAMVSMTAVEGGPRATDRVASRLSEQRLYDQIERFGARGAGVNVRF
jgi:hypothetical protein